MTPSFGEVVERIRSGPRIEERDFDMDLFRAAERLKRAYDIRFDPGVFVPRDDAMADRCYAAGRELYAATGSWCIDTRSVARFSPDELDAAMASAPDAVKWGDADDAFILRHRPVEGRTPAFVWGGVQTLLYSSEDTALAVCRDCCRCPDVHGVWGGLVPEVEGVAELRGGSPEELIAYRRSALTLRRAAREAGRPGMPVMNGAPLSMTHFSMFAGADGLRPTDGIETGGIPELKTSMDQLQRTAFALSTGTVHSGGMGVIIGGYSGSVEGAAIVAVASAFACRLVNQGRVVVLTATPLKQFSRSSHPGIWISSLALQALNRNTRLVMAGLMCDHPLAGPGTAAYLRETAAGTIPAVVCGTNPWGGTRKFSIGQRRDFGSPVESHFLGRISRAATGLDRELADRVAGSLHGSLAAAGPAAPEAQGMELRGLYDLETSRPAEHYLRTWNAVAAELRALGVPLDDYTE